MRSFILVIFGCICFPLLSYSQITWEETIQVAGSDYGNNHPRMVLNTAGEPLIIWGKSGNAMYSKWDGDGFTEPVQLNPDGTSIAEADWMGPDIAAYGDTIYVVFKETPENDDNSHIWCLASFDGGTTFGNPVRVEDVPDGRSRFAEVSTDDEGNPVVAFMRFDMNFIVPRWVVTRSDDYGNSFLPDVKASGWSSQSSEVCDCCPGTVLCSGNTIVMVYRDNNSNIRDNWAGVSTDLGNTFSGGMNLDKQNWMLNACPASGPDGIIIGDSLYSVSMNGANGISLVYFNSSYLPDMKAPEGMPLTGEFQGLNQQNYPRITHDGAKTAIVWKQIVMGVSQLPVLYTNDIADRFPDEYELIALQDVDNPDVALAGDKIYVVWQDVRSKSVKYRRGTITETSATLNSIAFEDFQVSPNPSSNGWQLAGPSHQAALYLSLLSIDGQVLYTEEFEARNEISHRIENNHLKPGVYLLRLFSFEGEKTLKLIKE